MGRKKRIGFIAVMAILIAGMASAQQTDITKGAQLIQNTKEAKIDSGKYWNVGGIISINFAQASFTNWAAGGQNSIGLASLASLHANYKKDKFSWLNDAELGYGFQKLDNELLQKTTDQIALTSSVGYKIFDHVSLSFLTNFQTQFQPGYTNTGDSVLLSDFMSPAYWVLAAGLQWSPNKYFGLFVSPATARLTFVEDKVLSDAGAYGVDTGKTELTQVGAYVKANFSMEVVKNVTITTNLELFSDYLKNPQNIVVNWTTFIQLKVNKYISATINTQLIYDNNILIPIYKDVNGVNTVVAKGPRLQFKDVGGVGLAINLR